MTDQINYGPECLLPSRKAAAMLSVSTVTLSRWRCRRTGPRFAGASANPGRLPCLARFAPGSKRARSAEPVAQTKRRAAGGACKRAQRDSPDASNILRSGTGC